MAADRDEASPGTGEQAWWTSGKPPPWDPKGQDHSGGARHAQKQEELTDMIEKRKKSLKIKYFRFSIFMHFFNVSM